MHFKLDILIPLIVYMFSVFGAVWYAYSRRNKKNFLSEYFLGDRSLNGFTLAMTATATYIGASTFIGGPGAAYEFGLGWVLLAMIQVPSMWFALGVLGKTLAKMSKEHNILTINDLLLFRYKNKWIVYLASFSLIFSFMVSMAAQFIGGARLLQVVFGVNYIYALIGFCTVVALYAFWGGFRSIVLTDTIQGVIMTVGIVLLLGGVIYSVGGVHKGVETLAHINKGLVSPYGYKGILTYGFMASFWILVCFGLVGMPPTIIRAMAYKNSKSLYHAMLYATIAIIVIMFGINLAGAFGRILIPNVGVPDEVIPKLMLKVLPPLLAGVFLAAPMAAIMSTFTSVLIQASSVFVKDIYLSVYPSKATNSKLISRLSTIVILSIIGILFLLTIHPPRMLVWLNIFGLGGLEAVFFWVIVLGIFWKKANANGAIASMIVGFLVYLISNIFSYGTFDYKALAEALFCAGISFVIFNNIKLKQKR